MLLSVYWANTHWLIKVAKCSALWKRRVDGRGGKHYRGDRQGFWMSPKGAPGIAPRNPPSPSIRCPPAQHLV